MEPMETECAEPDSRSEPAKEAFKQADEAHLNLINEWNKSSQLRIMNQVGTLLEIAKLKLTNLEYFLPCCAKNAPQNDLLLARDILEIGAFYSLAKEIPDTKMFERYMSQLKTYYFDYGSVLNDSLPSIQSRKFELLTVNLLFLLTEGRIAEFHTELELILNPSQDQMKILENEYVSRAVEIGKCLEEGRYNTILETQGSEKKSTACQFFVTKLFETSRAEIAETLEQAYEKIGKDVACKRLHFSDTKAFSDFVQKRGWNKAMDNKYFYFNTKMGDNSSIPSKTLIPQFLAYAKELEKIV